MLYLAHALMGFGIPTRSTGRQPVEQGAEWTDPPAPDTPEQNCADHSNQAEQGNGEPLMTGQPKGNHSVWVKPEWQRRNWLAQPPLFERKENTEKSKKGQNLGPAACQQPGGGMMGLSGSFTRQG